jgi:hypothetical protein
MAVHKCAHRQRPHFGRIGRRSAWNAMRDRVQVPQGSGVPVGRGMPAVWAPEGSGCGGLVLTVALFLRGPAKAVMPVP